MTSELLQEERDAGACALVTEVTKPTLLGGSSASLGFTASDQPLDPVQVESRKGREKGSAEMKRTAAGTRRR